jgi:hypothetical protein
MTSFSIEHLERLGFEGFVAARGLSASRSLPWQRGVYAFVTRRRRQPSWRELSPLAPVEEMRREWVVGLQTLLIGAAYELPRRVGSQLRFARFAPSPDWLRGDRLLWHAEQHGGLLVAWRETRDYDRLEGDLLEVFRAPTGSSRSPTSSETAPRSSEEGRSQAPPRTRASPFPTASV